ncbi:Ankyrin repeat domain-containing protein [Tetrabaena socialis]|uniref:Ankyrin repeat domain-containing protein n=1 Tax=Tetrabaena socialis TaxID=47790 RepID=A0A2J7ZP76_9CHLO|nr:Ankyrin repeat domain-containing protein [Tetrabaena socialis]|eukprot:PNH02074.1 Ankyrin repeat domain-containing protein [Tetrabaena socialis]
MAFNAFDITAIPCLLVRQTPPPSQEQQQQQQPDSVPDLGTDDPSHIWLPEVVHHFARFLGGNELAATLRLVNKATAAQFRGPQHTTVRLSLPVPHHAFVRRWGSPDATRSLTVRQRKQLPCLTACSGSVANLEVLRAREDLASPMSNEVLEAAAGAGQLEVCRWLRQQGCAWDGCVPAAAARAGHKEVCEWLLVEGCPFSAADAMAVAASAGHRAVCEWLLTHGCPEDMGAATAAARGGHVDLMDWLLAQTGAQSPGDVHGLMVAAAVGCDLPTLQRLYRTYLDSRGEELDEDVQEEIVKAAVGSLTADWRDKVEWLEGRGCPRHVQACLKAATRVDGRERLRWLQRRGYLITGSVVIQAAAHGNADALGFLLAQDKELLDEEVAGAATYYAAQGGHLAALKVLHAHGACIDHPCVSAAAAFGHLPVVAWGVEALGAATALTADVCAFAASSGSTELLTWLHQHGCPWGPSVFAAVAGWGSEEQLEWLVEHGCPMGDNGEPYQRALENNDMAMLHCLRRLGFPWGARGLTFTSAIQACHASTPFLRTQLLLALTWLVEQGCPVNWAVAEQGADGREVVHHFASFLDGNDLACTLRLADKATAAQFRGPQHTTVQLSRPVPHHAFTWRWGSPDATRSLTVRQRKQLPCLAARSGSICNLEILLGRGDLTSPLEMKVMEDAASAGQLEVCRWLRQQGCPWNGGMFNAAAGAGHKEVFEWLLDECCFFRPSVMMGYAAGGGHRALCEWLLTIGCPVDVGAASAAARGGHMGLMDWLLEQTPGPEPGGVWVLLEAAASGCDLPALQRLHDTYLDSRGAQLSSAQQEAVLVAAAGSTLENWRDKVEWLQGRGYPLTVHVAYTAIVHGNADALAFLLTQLDEADGQLDEDDIYMPVAFAAEKGHLAGLKVLHAHGAPIDHQAALAAAGLSSSGGQLPVVAWLVEVLGAATALTADVCKFAASSGSSELLAWLHERGCPWDASVFAAAAGGGSEQQLEWLVERGCPMGDDGEPYQRALENTDLAMLRRLRLLRCPWGSSGLKLTCAIRTWRTRTLFMRKQLQLALTWLEEQGCPVDWVAAEREAEKQGGGEVLAWVRQLQPSSV